MSEVTIPKSLKGPSLRADCAVAFVKNIIEYIAKLSDIASNEIDRTVMKDLDLILPLNRSEYKNVEVRLKTRVKVGFGLIAYKVVEETNKAKKHIKF